MYEIRWDEDAREDMKRMKLRAYEVSQIVDSVEEQLTHEPETSTRNKKIIRPGQRLPFEHLEPVWELRVGEFRVFYDVAHPEGSDREETEPEEGERDEGEREEEFTFGAIVSIRAVRRKPPHKTSGEIL
jgi:mRNA-degrading endonuclease RelE of RelBE toxin-antitoxin system